MAISFRSLLSSLLSLTASESERAELASKEPSVARVLSLILSFFSLMVSSGGVSGNDSDSVSADDSSVMCGDDRLSSAVARGAILPSLASRALLLLGLFMPFLGIAALTPVRIFSTRQFRLREGHKPNAQGSSDDF